MTKNFYDLEQIRGIPILEVCSAFGIKVRRSGRTYTCKLRDEKTPSVHLYTRNNNGQDNFYDFGVNEGGDVIVFVSKILNTDWQSALENLASTFGIEPVNNTEYRDRNELTNYQYEKIGVYGDLATKNLDFNLEKYTLESAQKYSDKYNMTVNELRSKYPEFYTHKILMNKALPYVLNLRNSYYTELYNHYVLAKNLRVQDPTALSDSFIQKLNEKKNELVTAEKLLYKAAKGTSLEERLSVRSYDVESDFHAILNGEISFQVGSVPYFEIKQAARKNDEVVHYRSVSVDDYESMLSGLLGCVSYAAFLKADKVNLAFLPEDSDIIERVFETFRLNKGVDEQVAEAEAKKDKTEVGKNQKSAVCEVER